MSESPPILSLRNVSKSFGAVQALSGVRLDLYAGEAHGLVGENGAGKSTLVKILAGAHPADAGTLLVDGKERAFSGPADAQAAGIAVIYQEPTLFPDLSVAENIFMGRQPLRGMRRIDAKAMRAATSELFARLGVGLDPDRPARGLSIADQQLVEIAKALAFDARVLIMDEPTAALSGVEVERLFSVVGSLRESGAAVLFISHRFDEIFTLCSRITVMRDGRWVSTGPAAELTVEELVRRMVGREVSSLYPESAADLGAPRLEVRGLTRHGVFGDVSFTVRGGEIVALAGLVGAGRSEVARAVFGVDRPDAGEVIVDGRTLPPGDTAAQARLPMESRRANVRGAFRVREAALLAGKRLLLIDDVLTSGATAGEAARVLLRGGATEVKVLCLAVGAHEAEWLWRQRQGGRKKDPGVSWIHNGRVDVFST